MSKQPQTIEILEDRRLLSSAHLDPTFGENGVVVLPHAVDMESFQALAQQSDGKILAAGNHFGFHLGRFLADGSLDTDFGVDGYADFGYGALSALNVVRVQDDGKIVVAGNDEYSATCGHSDVFVARLNSDGTFDTSFGTDGKIRANYYADSPCSASSNDRVNDMVVLADGRILVAGGAVPVIGDLDNPRNDFALLRLNADGTYDTSFGDDGKVVTGGGDAITAVALLPDGRILAAGNAFSSDGGYDIALLRYNADGSPDNSFGTGGKVLVDLTSSDTVHAMTVLSDGRILVAGQLHDSGFIARFLANGSLDTTFGVPRTGWITPADNTFAPSQMQVDEFGYITLADASHLRLARYYLDGLPDEMGISPSLSVPGYAGLPYIPAMLMVPDGIFVAGALSKEAGGPQDPFIARYVDSKGASHLDFSMAFTADSFAPTPVGGYQTVGVRVYNNGDQNWESPPPIGCTPVFCIPPSTNSPGFSSVYTVLQLYLSKDDHLSADDQQVWFSSVSFLNGIAAHSSEPPRDLIYFQIPPNVLVNNKPTRYTLIGRINTNPNGRVLPETTYDNNTTVGPTITFLPAKVDLQLSIASLPKFLSRSDPNKISLIIKNLGNIKASGRALLRLFHTHERGVAALAKAFATRKQNLNLDPGQSKRITLSLRSGGGWSTRDFLYVSMDWKGNLPDQKPGNNSVFSSTRIRFI
jgi:uncharacterized delta-60 repeat protein